jgi:heme A synthase
MSQQENLERLPAKYDRISSQTETREELEHRLWREKFTHRALSLALFLVFFVLVYLVLFHPDLAIQQNALSVLASYVAGLLGYFVRK